jgi:hypothetical protein
MTRTAVAAPLAVIAIGTLLAACGGDEEALDRQQFDAEEFVEAINEEGAEVELGDELESQQEGTQVFAFEFEDHAGEHREDGDDHGHGSGGSIVVTSDDEAGVAEYQRCESAVTLLCYRVSNVVMFFEDEAPDEDIARIGAAITSFAD